ncbi:helix-turn-helix transcriptional regulator [Halostreptopolyspora alba]|uniref:WYL domain-containing transcriptional regulator n=1 Tax=Halostreptopolyspora alba TaxID=2487137 RepID=A0A3N0E6G2_9ACTN|nr:WYL domain-containing transcriptional regulator [Nocardiopsaceae bacterium YIM 96095]
MSDTTIARVLRLLALLQARRFWLGRELAARVGVSERTLRRDIDRLRELGYRVTAERGRGGGYSLQAGTDLPPLLLDDDELVVLVAGLRTLAAGGGDHADDTALSALAKLEQLLPGRLRRRVSALQSATVARGSRPASTPAPELLAQLALACRDAERVRFGYTGVSGTRAAHLVEPHCLVSVEQDWYLVAWEVRGGAWEAFRVNRVDSYVATGERFTGHELDPERAGEIAAAAAVRFARRHVGLLRVHAPLGVLRERVGAWAREATAETDTTTLWPISADHLPGLVFGLAWLPEEYDFEVLESSELRAFVRSLGTRLVRATTGSAR